MLETICSRGTPAHGEGNMQCMLFITVSSKPPYAALNGHAVRNICMYNYTLYIYIYTLHIRIYIHVHCIYQFFKEEKSEEHTNALRKRRDNLEIKYIHCEN